MRLIASLLVLLFLASSSAVGLQVEKFDMRTDRLVARHYRGGKTAAWVKKSLKADFVTPAGFYGGKTINGRALRHGVDLTIANGEEKIPDLFKGRKVLAVYRTGEVRIFPNYEHCLSWGKPEEAVAGMTIPPRPNERLRRQFWATKGQFYFRVTVVGNRWDCLRIARDWGFEHIVHMDGGSSLDRSIVHPSWLAVFRGGLNNVAS